MKGYFGGLIKMTGLTFGTGARPGTAGSVTTPIHMEETKFVEPRQGPETGMIHQGAVQRNEPLEMTATVGNLEHVPVEEKKVAEPPKEQEITKHDAGIEEEKYSQSQPGQEAEKIADSTGEDPGRAEQVIKIRNIQYEMEEGRDGADFARETKGESEVISIRQEVVAGEQEAETFAEPANETGKEGTALPITLKTVKEWVAGSPVKETAGGQAPIQENREFNLSIGTINLTVEEPRAETPVNKPPQIKNNAPVISNPRPSRLERHYIRIR